MTNPTVRKHDDNLTKGDEMKKLLITLIVCLTMAACAGFGDKVRRFNQGEYFGRETGTRCHSQTND